MEAITPQETERKKQVILDFLSKNPNKGISFQKQEFELNNGNPQILKNAIAEKNILLFSDTDKDFHIKHNAEEKTNLYQNVINTNDLKASLLQKTAFEPEEEKFIDTLHSMIESNQVKETTMKIVFQEQNPLKSYTTQEIVNEIQQNFSLKQQQALDLYWQVSEKSFKTGEYLYEAGGLAQFDDFSDKNLSVNEKMQVINFINTFSEKLNKGEFPRNELDSFHQAFTKDIKQFDYLKKQLKYLGFGESEQLHKDLEYGIKNAEGKFQIQTTSDKVMKGNKADFTLNFNKSEEGKVFFNSYKATLTTSQGVEREHSFKVQKENNITAKEAINLLEGRTVKFDRSATDKETGEITQATDFIKLKLNEEKTEFGNYKIERYGKNYGIDIDQIMEKSNLNFANDTEKEKVKKHLEKGNITSVNFKHENKDIKGFAVLNPQWKMLNLYDEKMNRVNSNKMSQTSEIEQNQKKNMPQQRLSIGI